jgi:hypothetical protein
MQTTLSDLTSQLAILKRPAPSDTNEVKALMIRANNAERRLANAQNQLAAAEEKIAAMNQKTTAADSKWEARVKEYETRLRAAEEKVKRERQGYKERMLELENQIKCALVRPSPFARLTGLSINSSDPYRDKERLRTSGTSSWPTSRPRYHTRCCHQHGSICHCDDMTHSLVSFPFVSCTAVLMLHLFSHSNVMMSMLVACNTITIPFYNISSRKSPHESITRFGAFCPTLSLFTPEPPSTALHLLIDHDNGQFYQRKPDSDWIILGELGGCSPSRTRRGRKNEDRPCRESGGDRRFGTNKQKYG